MITEDLDFGELIFRDQLEAYGIILLRIIVESREAKFARILDVIQTEDKRLIGTFTVMTEKDVRLRPLPKIES